MPINPLEPIDGSAENPCFPPSFRFEKREVLSPLPTGPFNTLAAVSDDPAAAIWLFRHARAKTIECHVVTDTDWIHFSLSDNTMDEADQFEWQFVVDYIWRWDSEKYGPSPSRPDRLVAKSQVAGIPFAQLDSVLIK